MVSRHFAVTLGALSALGAAALSANVAHWKRANHSPAVAASGTAAPSAPASVRAGDGRVAPGPPSMLHLDPRHTNRSPFRGPRSVKIEWTFDTGGPVEAAPIVLDDGTIVVASLGGTLFALDPAGQVRFRVELADRIYASPLASGDLLFIGSDNHRFWGITRAGVVRFRMDTEGDMDTGAVPTPWGGIVFASGSVVYASKPDGTLLWRSRARRKSYSSPAVGEDGTVFVGSQDHHLYAIAPDGQIRWSQDLGADVDSSPAVEDDGTVVAGTDNGEIIAFEPERGGFKWRAHVGGYVRGAISLGRDGTVLAGTYGPTPRLVGLAPDDGAERLSFSIPGNGASEFGIHGGPVEDAAGRLYFGTQDDQVYCVGADGKLVWKFKTGADVDAPVVITPEGRLLVGSDDGKLYVLAPD
jgi:outer membrane protein assembly factor BamB